MNNLDTHIENMVINNESLTNVLELAQLKGVDILADKKGKIIAKNQHIKLLDFVIQDTSRTYFKVMAKFILLSEVEKALPLATIMAMFAVTVKMDNRHGFRLAGVILNLMKQAHIMREEMRKTQNGYLERVVILVNKWSINDDLKDQLSNKVSKKARTQEPTPWSAKVKGGYAGTKKISGSRLNEKLEQPQRIYDVLNHLQSSKYELDIDVLEHFSKEIMMSFPVEQQYVEMGRLLEEANKITGKAASFAYNFGANGRVYCEGYRTHRQAGIRNELFNFANKRIINTRGLELMEDRLAELKAENQPSDKARIQIFKLERDINLVSQGKAVGTILHWDAKLSGLQVGAVSMRDKSLAEYCGLLDVSKDGYMAMANELKKYNLTRDNSKKSFVPYMYGASKGDVLIDAMVNKSDYKVTQDMSEYYKDWTKGFVKVFKAEYGLMGIVKMLSEQQAKKGMEHYRWTAPSGFNVSIGAITTTESEMDTVMGKHSFAREEIDPKEIGVKLIAAYSHTLDASLLHEIVLDHKEANIEIDVIHDSYGVCPNDSDFLLQSAVKNLRNMLNLPILENFLNDIDNSGYKAKMFLSNTLSTNDITGALYS